MRYLLIAGSVAVFTATALADVSLSSVELDSTSPGMAVLSADVTGTGDVFAEYAHDKSKSFRSVKDRYVTDGLIAMWDAVDNMGTGSHVPDATTWRDLTGNHDDMNFTNSVPTIGANYYDMSAGGCGTPDEVIATAFNAGAVTVEIVCNVSSIVNDSTLFACVDGTGSGAGTRFGWVRSYSGNPHGVVAIVDYERTATQTNPNIDMTLNVVHSYSFKFGSSSCSIYTNGVSTGKTCSSGGQQGNVTNAWFSLGQRISKGGQSPGIMHGRIHCVRVYNRELTDEEIAANLAVDGERFKDPPSIDFANPGQAVVEKSLVGSVKGLVPYVKNCYVASGLIAMWDGEDNQGTAEHVEGVRTWVDLTGRHADMVFTNVAPTIGANYYDVSADGGFISDASDIAAALNAEACTIEIVCDAKSLVDDGTLFACVDKDGKRMAWARTNSKTTAKGVVGVMEYKSSGSYEPNPKFDDVLNHVRSYTFTYSNDLCRVYKDGSSEVGASVTNKMVLGDVNSAYFSVGRRISKSSQSTPVADLKIYCLRVYDRVLTPEEIASNHEADFSRFFSAESAELPEMVKVVNSDGTSSFYPEGEKIDFRLMGLRPDLANYTARLFTTNATPSVTPSVTFESAAERPTSAWYEFLDSRAADRSYHLAYGPLIDLDYAPNGDVPSVETRYQILGGNNHAVFGAIESDKGTFVMLYKQDDILKLRYRVDDGGGWAALPDEELYGEHVLVLNGPDGTYLNGNLLDGSLANKTALKTRKWLLFARNCYYNYDTGKEFGYSKVWYFRLFSNGELIRDLVPARGPDGACMFDRVSMSFYPNVGTRQFCLGPELPGLSLRNTIVAGRSLTTELTRTDSEASDVYVVYGDRHGGATLDGWEHSEKLSARFAAGDTSLSVTLPQPASAARYVRFFSVADGWSDSAYIPDTKAGAGLMIFVR